MRDPLLALGCQDPVERVSRDEAARWAPAAVAELFAIWWEKHGDRPVAVRQLHDDVKQVADPQGRGRQYLASNLEKLAGTRMAGFVLTRQAAAGKWGTATYRLEAADDPAIIGVIGVIGPTRYADAPYAPYADQDHKNGSTLTAAFLPPQTQRRLTSRRAAG